MTVVWIDIWDFQSSSAAKNIINCQFNIGQYIATIHGTNINSGIPQCKNCWKQGHSHVSRCTKCYGAHVTEHHREKVWCCMKNKKANYLATLEGEPYSNVFKYINCKRDYQVDSYNCPYWHNCFNREQHSKKQQELFQKQSKVIQLYLGFFFLLYVVFF